MAHMKILDKLSTGVPALDVAICCALPIIAPRIKRAAQALWRRARRRCEPPASVFVERIITCSMRYGRCVDNSHNKTLQDAILMYLGSKPDVTDQFQVRGESCVAHICVILTSIAQHVYPAQTANVDIGAACGCFMCITGV